MSRVRHPLALTLLVAGFLLGLAGPVLSSDVVIATYPTGVGPVAVAVNPVTHKVYVPNYYGDSVTVADGVSDSVVATIPMPRRFYGAAIPNAVVVDSLNTPNKAFVANWQSHSVTVIDEPSMTIVGTITVPAADGGNPRALALNPGSTPPKLYVANYHTQSVSVIDASTTARIKEVRTGPVGASPRALALFASASRTRVYVANRANNTVVVLDGDTDTSVATLTVGAAPKAIAVDSGSGYAYVTNENGNSVTVIDDTDHVAATVGVGTRPTGLAVDSSNGRVFVANYNSNNVSVIDTATNSVVATVGVGTNPWSVAVDQSLGKAFVSNYGTSTVTVIDNALASTTVQTGRGPYALAVNEGISPHKTYVGNWFSRTVSVIDEPAAQGAALGMRISRAEAAGTGPIEIVVQPLAGDRTAVRQPTIEGTASSRRGRYPSNVLAVYVRYDDPRAPWTPATITAGVGTPQVSWRAQPAGELALGAHTLYVAAVDQAGAVSVSSEYGAGAVSGGPAGGVSYGFAVEEETQATGTLSGRVRGRGKPVAGIHVDLYGREGQSWSRQRTVTTGGSGAYSFTTVPVGVYRLGFRDASKKWVNEYYHNAYTLLRARDVTVTAGATTTIEEHLQPMPRSLRRKGYPPRIPR